MFRKLDLLSFSYEEKETPIWLSPFETANLNWTTRVLLLHVVLLHGEYWDVLLTLGTWNERTITAGSFSTQALGRRASMCDVEVVVLSDGVPATIGIRSPVVVDHGVSRKESWTLRAVSVASSATGSLLTRFLSRGDSWKNSFVQPFLELWRISWKYFSSCDNGWCQHVLSGVRGNAVRCIAVWLEMDGDRFEYPL